MVLGDDQYYYISLCEDQDSICLIMVSDESAESGNDTGFEERRKLVHDFEKALINIVKSLSKSPEEIQLPTAYIPCPRCNELHLLLEFVCSKRALRCRTKLPLGYYSDLKGVALA